MEERKNQLSPGFKILLYIIAILFAIELVAQTVIFIKNQQSEPVTDFSNIMNTEGEWIPMYDDEGKIDSYILAPGWEPVYNDVGEIQYYVYY